jgi:protein CWC15
LENNSENAKFKHFSTPDNVKLAMTSAARPTWSAALSSGGGLRDGSSAAPTLQTCSKDQPGHLKLKLRQVGQNAPEERLSRAPDSNAELSRNISNLITGDSDVEIDSDENEAETFLKSDSSPQNITLASEDEIDEEEELLMELEKIRREREMEKNSISLKEFELDPQAILARNPLLAVSSIEESTKFGAKQRWDNDVVFKNQAKGVEEKPQKRFINDTTRSDFHRRFMDKFIK